MTKDQEAKQAEWELREAVRRLAHDLVTMQRRCFEEGFIKTAHALNKASGELGWEAAEWIEKQMKERKK
jgi:hypothetical protein